MYIFHFKILYFDPKEEAEKWSEGYICTKDISFAAGEIMDELGIEPEQISSINIDRGKKFILL